MSVVQKLYLPLLTLVFSFAPAAAQNGLRDIAEDKKVYIGNIISNQHLDNPTTFRGGLADANLTEEYNAVVLENYMKMSFVLPASEPPNIHELSVAELQEVLRRDKIDLFLDRPEWANLRKRGHAMIWFNQAPGWLNAAGPTWTAEQVFSFSRKYILALGNICGDRMDEWDVINEAIGDNTVGGLRVWRPDTWYRRANDGSETTWGTATYENYIKMLFVWAREAQPNARLYYNDYAIENFNTSATSRNRFMRDKFKALKECGAPIDGIGFQSHFVASDMVSSTGVVNQDFINSIRQTMEDLADADLEVAITELDVRICNGDRAESTQEPVFEAFVQMALEQPNCRELLIWGLRDEDNWITLNNNPPFNGCQDPVIFEGAGYDKKGAYFGVERALQALPDRDDYDFPNLNPGNGAPADCGGDPDGIMPLILSVNGPRAVRPGDSVTVTVSYVATGEQDLIVVFQLDSDPFTVYQAVTTDVSEGAGELDIRFEVPEDTPPVIDGYQYQVFIAPDGGDFGNRFSNIAQTDVDVLGEGEFIDEVITVMGPDSVSPGTEVLLDVTFSANVGREMVVYLQLDLAPFTVYSTVREALPEGEGSLQLTVPVPLETPLGEDILQYQVLIVPPGGGWPDRIANLGQINVTSFEDPSGLFDRPLNELSLTAFPNPTVAEATIGGLEDASTTIAVHAVSGAQFRKLVVRPVGGMLPLPLGDLPAGIYLVRVVQDGKTGVLRLVKR